jgi:hypothetical protein
MAVFAVRESLKSVGVGHTPMERRSNRQSDADPELVEDGPETDDAVEPEQLTA